MTTVVAIMMNSSIMVDLSIGTVIYVSVGNTVVVVSIGTVIYVSIRHGVMDVPIGDMSIGEIVMMKMIPESSNYSLRHFDWLHFLHSTDFEHF